MTLLNSAKEASASFFLNSKTNKKGSIISVVGKSTVEIMELF